MSATRPRRQSAGKHSKNASPAPPQVVEQITPKKRGRPFKGTSDTGSPSPAKKRVLKKLDANVDDGASQSLTAAPASTDQTLVTPKKRGRPFKVTPNGASPTGSPSTAKKRAVIRDDTITDEISTGSSGAPACKDQANQQTTPKKRGRPFKLKGDGSSLIKSPLSTPKRVIKEGNDEQSAMKQKRLKKENVAPSPDVTPAKPAKPGRRVRGTGIKEYTGTIRHVRSVAKVMAGVKPSLSTRASALSIATSPADLARHALHLSSVPATLPCREEEYGMVYGCIAGALEEGMGTCIYISGIPGTGKTATVHEVVKTLQQLADESEIPAFEYVEINGMKITDPTHSYVLLWEALSGNNELTTSKNAMGLLQKHFHGPSSEQQLW